jgi:hypothetical protein
LCLNYTFNWSVENQIEEQVYRTLPSDLTGVGHFVAHCFFDVGGGKLGNGIGRLIMQYYGGFDDSKSPFALRGPPEFGKCPDNTQCCSDCRETRVRKSLLDCASCGRVRYCSRDCQKIDRKRHKVKCKIWTEEKKTKKS